MANNFVTTAGDGTGKTFLAFEATGGVNAPGGIVVFATDTTSGASNWHTPLAAALADNTANPTTILHGSCGMVYDGAAWDMLRGDATNGMLVNLGSNNEVTLAVLPDTAGGDLAAMVVDLAAIEVLLTQIDADTGGIATSAASIDGKVTACNTGAVVVSSSALPSGAATSAKQPALGTAGTASADVLSVQGIASMTALTVDGSGVTQPVSGTVTANLSAVDNAVLDAIAASVAGTLTVGSHAVTNAGTFAVQVNGDALTALQLIDDAVYTGGAGTPSKGLLIQGTDGTNPQNIRTDSSGYLQVRNNSASNLYVAAAVYSESAFVSSTNGLYVRPQASQVWAVSDNSGTLTVDLPAVATGGATPGKLVSAASTNATSVKGSGGTLYSLVAMTTDATPVYLKLYNKATAPTVGTDTPVQVFMLPGNATGAGCVIPIPTCGIEFATGIAFALTTGAADSDTGAVAANEVVVSYSYK